MQGKRSSVSSESQKNTLLRFEELLKSRRYIAYHEDLPDKEFPYVLCSIIGAPKTNELFVKLTNGVVTVVEAIKSRLDFPAMEDRVFGMDVLDGEDAFMLADKMWKKYRSMLVLKS